MDCNTKEGIAQWIGTYADLYALLKERLEKGAVTEEQAALMNRPEELSPNLHPFIILGRFRSNGFGDCARLNRAMFTDEDRRTMPTIMTDEEFLHYFLASVPSKRAAIVNMYDVNASIRGLLPLAPPTSRCHRCNGEWTLEESHDIELEFDPIRYSHGTCFRRE